MPNVNKKASKTRAPMTSVSVARIMFPNEDICRRADGCRLLLASLADAELVNRCSLMGRRGIGKSGWDSYEPAAGWHSWAMVRNQAKQHLEAVKVALALGDSLSG